MKTDRNKIKALFPELENVKDRELAEKTVDMWEYFWSISEWETLEEAAFNCNNNGMTLIKHTQSVLRCALALADIISTVQGETIDNDILIVSCILHDVSKLIEYSPAEEKGYAVETPECVAYQHAFLGAAKANEMGFPMHVVKLVLNHTPQTSRKSNSIEGLMLGLADVASAFPVSKKYDFN